MPFILVEGPEATGKTTLIAALRSRWLTSPQSAEREFLVRKWGPQTHWQVYQEPLLLDLGLSRHEHTLVVWDRGWVSRFVYNKLLEQGFRVDAKIIRKLDRQVLAAGGTLSMVTTPARILAYRRAERQAAGDSKDHPLDPATEAATFEGYADVSRGWLFVNGAADVEHNANEMIVRVTRP